MPDQYRQTIHPEASALFDYWLQEKGDRPLPGRTALNPSKLRRWLGDISIVELHDGPKQFFVRLHGGRTQDRVGNDMTRCYFEDVIDPKTLEFALTPYKAAAKSMVPTHSMFVPRLYPAVFSKLERLVLPFSAKKDVPAEPTVDEFIVWAGPTGHSDLGDGSVYDKLKNESVESLDFAKVIELRILDGVSA